MRSFGVYIFIIVLFANNVNAQVPDKSWLENFIEEQVENSDNEESHAELLETFEYYISNPLNLNTATREELAFFPFLSDEQIESLKKYIRRKGQMLSIYELQYIDGFDYEVITKLLPFVMVQPEDRKYAFSFKKYLTSGKQNLLLKTQFGLEEAEGYLPISDSLLALKPNARYLGSKYKVYARYSYQFKNDLKYGFTLEKDPGEEFFTGTQKTGFDFMSGHFQIQNQGLLDNLVIGDYSANFGQGLVMQTGFGSSKSAYPLMIKKKSSGLRKYSSVNENEFLRGIGASLKYKDWLFTPFFSYHSVDANLNYLDTIDNEFITEATSLQISGLHATPAQLDDKHSLNIMVSGANLKISKSSFNLGLTYAYTQFNQPLDFGEKAYQLYSFNGTQSQNLGLDYYYLFKSHIHFFGEEAIRFDGGLATLNGLVANLAPQVKVSLLHRYYSPDYWGLYINGFGEKSSTNNESGLYIGTEIYPRKSWKISAYVDNYRFPWLNFSTYAPSSGVDYLIQIDKNIARYLDIYVRFKQETKQLNVKTDVQYEITNATKKSFRIHASYSPLKSLYLKSRAEFSFYDWNQTIEKGYMIYQDVVLKPLNIPISFSVRYALFNTSYNTRIYAYENDILYAFSIPAYFYKGTRTYANIKYSITNKVDLWLRWSQFYYPDAETISSGLNEIQGNTKSEIKVQLRIKF